MPTSPTGTSPSPSGTPLPGLTPMMPTVAFALQSEMSGGLYRGAYTEENGFLYFKFESSIGWTAHGWLEGNSLKVQFRAA